MDELIKWLEFSLKSCLDTCQVWEDGTVLETRRRVDLLEGRLKIEIYSNEHPPAHFHVKYNGLNVSFRIDNCEKIEGEISNKDYKIVQYWFKHPATKTKLIEVWDKTRSINCSVGKYIGNDKQ